MPISMNTGHSNRKKWIVLAIYLIYLFILTLSPYEFSTFWFKKLSTYRLEKLIVYLLHFNPMDHFNNVLLFIPLGLILRVFFTTDEEQTRKGKWKKPLLMGMTLSLFVELIQLFLDRSTTLNDVVMNSSGTLIGYHLLVIPWFKKIFDFVKKRSRSFGLAVAILVSIAFIGTSLLPLHLNRLVNWNESFPLLIGNELSMDRPWEGEIYHLAIYDQAIRQVQAANLYRLGMETQEEQTRQKVGAIAQFAFHPGYGDTLTSLDHSICISGDHIQWTEDGMGVWFIGGSVLKSEDSVADLTKSLMRANQFSIEVWIQTDNFKQGGPARIVSLSGGTSRRNFTLCQQSRQIHLRVRTPLAGHNGSDMNLRADAVITSGQPYHLIATFNRGFESLYVNGNRHQDMIRAHLDFAPNLLLLGRNTVSKIVFSFFFAFPMGFLFHNRIRKKRFVWTLLICIGVVIAVESLLLILVGQPIGFFMIPVSLIFFLLGLGANIVYRKIQ